MRLCLADVFDLLEYSDPRADYDHGDCCKETCVDTDDYVCGTGRGFNCFDPEYRDDDYLESASYSYVFWCGGYWGGNGRCDDSSNNAECGTLFVLRPNTCQACGWRKTAIILCFKLK